MLTRARAAVLVLAGLTLAACGSIHPGDAAVVDGQSISMTTLNKTAEAFCDLTVRSAEAQGATAPENADIRRQAVTTLVSLVVARKLAAEQGVTPKPSEYELTSAQEGQIAEAFPDSDLEQINRAIEDSQELSALSVALGAEALGQTRSPDNEAQLAEAGQAEITKAFGANEVKFAPRFGLDSTTKQVAATLSVSPADLGEAELAELPAVQRCT